MRIDVSDHGMCGDTILLRGMPVFTHSSAIQGNVPSSLQGGLPGTVAGWLPVYIRTSIDPNDPAGGTFAKYYIPLYQP